MSRVLSDTNISGPSMDHDELLQPARCKQSVEQRFPDRPYLNMPVPESIEISLAMLIIVIQCNDMQHNIPRPRITRQILRCLKESPVTALLGTRQTDKTTLARMVSEKRRDVHYFDLERAGARKALSTPELTLESLRG